MPDASTEANEAVETPAPEQLAASEPEAELEIALDLDPGDVAALRGVPELRRPRGTRARTATVQITWHDTADSVLAREGRVVEEERTGQHARWRLVRMLAAADTTWVPGTPCPVLAEADHVAGLDGGWVGRLMPVVAFEGTRATARLERGGATLVLEQGVLRAVAAERAACRVVLRGDADTVRATALAVARAVRAKVAPHSFAAEAIWLARPAPASLRPEPPQLSDRLAVGDAFAHVVAHLTTTILTLAPAAAARDGMEPVHQMRVALRRLRSAMSLFQRAMQCPELDVTREDLRALGRVLGPARDWDVFTEETAARLEAFAEDAAVQRLLVAAKRRRAASYAALRDYLESPGFRVLGTRLACLAARRPWRVAEGAEDVPATLGEFAAHQLARLRRKMRPEGDDVAELPAAELHALRIRAKRLRYAAEFFAPLFPGKAMSRYIRRVSAVQRELGILNDGAVTARLVAELGRAPGYAAGVVAGDVAARAGDARARIAVAWRKLKRAPTGWN